MSVSNLYLLLDVSFTAGVIQPFPFFRSTNEVGAVAWMRANTERSDIILAAYETGNYIAAHAGNRVVVGHWAETLDWERRFAQTSIFFDENISDEWRKEFLSSNGVSYVWYGSQERNLGDFSPAKVDYLMPIYSEDEVEVFAVFKPKLTP